MADHIPSAKKADPFDGEEFDSLVRHHAVNETNMHRALGFGLMGEVERLRPLCAKSLESLRAFCRRVRDEAVDEALANHVIAEIPQERKCDACHEPSTCELVGAHVCERCLKALHEQFSAKSPTEPLPDQPGSVAPTGGTVGGGQPGERLGARLVREFTDLRNEMWQNNGEWPKWYAESGAIWMFLSPCCVMGISTKNGNVWPSSYSINNLEYHSHQITPDDALRLLEGT